MKNPIDVQGIYNDYIVKIDTTRREELQQTRPQDQPYYRPSSAGKCSRMIYYETIMRAEPSERIDKRVRRLFRLGNLIHEDLQTAFLKAEKSDYYLSIKNIYIYNIYTEKEILFKSLRVRGFIDLLVELSNGSMFLYDIKSIGSYPYKKIFARKAEIREPSVHQELQLATYGLAVKKEFGRLDGMFILYYNKDTSRLRYKEVSNDRLLTALGFWERINDEHSSGLPSLRRGISPVADWECGYCDYKTRCEEDREKGL
ncbi:hypothetical protein CMI37_36630 [Candidatus Pacearchaeota archaeon]|nr:hypothetical protein [Candidatus Pacearchaeota archaeon]|tara:strand:- start:2865 stop:3635 length:771 start_codon:yes stop_codon:yes gene_type:complete